MSENESESAGDTAPQVEAEKTPEADPESKKECPSSPTGEHDMFHNEGTDETYCRYCGKT